ncbi:MAG TPA: ATP-binding protein [Vicinamibacterales bacterium]|nr:ATP-binding protein [Vicinamibacterales bacterium]
MEAIGQLAGGVAHDFNNTLTAILGSAEFLLLDLPVDDPRRENAEEIASAGQRAAQLTRQLLAFSRKQILAPRVLHLGVVISQLTPMLRRLLGETIDLKTVASGRAAVMADAGQIEQVVMNLAINARDAMSYGGRLTIETADIVLDDTYARYHSPVPPGDYAVLAVSDTGHGMDEATRQRIFEPFFTTKGPGRGTGLGLATVYGIVKQSGGFIWVYSEVSRGTTFKVYLPRTDATEETHEPLPIDRGALRGHETILLVEDEDLVRDLVARTLRFHGYTVHIAEAPRRAIELASVCADAIDLILTDVVMPDMNGHVMAAEIQDRHPEAKVLCMSGYTDNAILHHGVLDRHIPFLQKPFSSETLLRTVRDTLHS